MIVRLKNSLGFLRPEKKKQHGKIRYGSPTTKWHRQPKGYDHFCIK